MSTKFYEDANGDEMELDEIPEPDVPLEVAPEDFAIYQDNDKF